MSRSNDIAGLTTSILDGVTAAEVGLGNVDNTADSAKPVSTAQQSAIDLKANIASPTFTGNVNLASNATGTFNGTIGTSYQVPRKIHSFYHKAYAEGIGTTFAEVLSYQFGSAVQANAFYTLSCSLWLNNENTTNSEKGDVTIAAYLQNSDGSKKYRFGYYKNNSGNDNYRLGDAGSASGGYLLSDTDGSVYANDSWNGTYWAFSEVAGAPSTSELTVASTASTFSSGEALILKVFLGSQSGGINYNVSQANGNRTSRNFSLYCIKEHSALG